MRAAILEITLFIPGASSLKDKRQVIKSIIERIKSRCNAAVAEVDHQDKWQLAVIGIALVALTQVSLEQQQGKLRRIVEDADAAEITHWNVDYY